MALGHRQAVLLLFHIAEVKNDQYLLIGNGLIDSEMSNESYINLLFCRRLFWQQVTKFIHNFS